MQQRANRNTKQAALKLCVRGLVQGVGFRPMVWRLANECCLTGDVLNDGGGVVVRVWGESEHVERFVSRLETEAPPLSQISSIERHPIADQAQRPDHFSIEKSVANTIQTGVVPDAATCPACLNETFDPAELRYRYPFTNCTHCGPRLSIVQEIPYDRANTSMRKFEMCQDCATEYDTKQDRRFHAQPIACPKCGPHVWLEDTAQTRVAGSAEHDAVSCAAQLIKDGSIIAIKGIGGFHLACDAKNHASVDLLRQRKHRYSKPFALMARDLAMVKTYAHVSSNEHTLLASPAAPIVVLQPTRSASQLAASIAPGQSGLGFMLPYTPLHSLLVAALDTPIVLTSGNISSVPQAINNDDARGDLAGIADYFLMHDRDIINRVDDSVVRVVAGKKQVLRRARGYAPAPITLPNGFENANGILAMGPELKNTFCMIKDGSAILSQHIGDLENASSYRDYRSSLDLFLSLYNFKADVIAVDAHPNYLSTQWGQELSRLSRIEQDLVQHHHAHIAACMADNDVPMNTKPVLGIALDGLGLGDDGTLWGGEFLVADYRTFQRVAHFRAVPMPGGAQAVMQPWRNTFVHLDQSIGWERLTQRYPNLAVLDHFKSKPLSQIKTIIKSRTNTPLTSSVGRIFDAVAGLLGICTDGVSYEGQAAIELETLAMSAGDERASYAMQVSSTQPVVIDVSPMWEQIVRDLEAKVPASRIAARFHNTMVQFVVQTALSLAKQHDIDAIALSGGVMQNNLLFKGLLKGLNQGGIGRVLTHARVPTNDGGLSLGQGVIAAARMAASRTNGEGRTA